MPRRLYYTRRLSVCLVCLSVCLLATSRKKYGSDLYENFIRDVSMDEVERFGSHPPPDSD